MCEILQTVSWPGLASQIVSVLGKVVSPVWATLPAEARLTRATSYLASQREFAILIYTVGRMFFEEINTTCTSRSE